MNVEEKVGHWIEQEFGHEAFRDCFLLEICWSPPRTIEVFIDSDSGVTFRTCQKLSRALEAYLDEDDQIPDDYRLTVSSGGVERPLVLFRQYAKHLHRTLQIHLKNGQTISGKLASIADDRAITLEVPIKEKGKKKRIESKTLNFDDIDKSFVQLSFK